MTNIVRILVPAILLAALTSPCTATPPSAIWPKDIVLPDGRAVDEAYRQEFDMCDKAGSFRGHVSRYTRGCADDPNAVTALRRLPEGVIAYVSKLAVDLDGSRYACGPLHGPMDQCQTSLMLKDDLGHEVPVDADVVPYVVIPEAGPPELAGEFARLTGLHVGDFGVVLAKGRTVPVIVADTGPFSKLGEGSLALHRLLGRDQCSKRDENGVCVAVVSDMASIGGDVTTILFPGSAKAGLTPGTIVETTRRVGLKLWRDYQRRHSLAHSPSG